MTLLDGMSEKAKKALKHLENRVKSTAELEDLREKLIGPINPRLKNAKVPERIARQLPWPVRRSCQEG